MTNFLRTFYYLHSMIRRAYWNHDRLIDYQNKRLRKTIRYAYEHVPFYHRKFRELRIKPIDIKTAKDLNKLPIIRKAEIKKNLDKMISKESNVNNLRKLSTSGSTGQPLFLYINAVEDEFRKAKHLRANISCGQNLRDRWVTVTSPTHFGEIMKFQRMLGVYAPIPVSVFNDLATQVSIIEKMKPDILDGYSSSLLLLAKFVEKSGLESIRPRFIISGAEFVGNSSLNYIEKTFGAPVYDQYACIELERIAWQCPQRMGYHMDVDTMIVQFVDNDGEEVSVGEGGEIVCTSLFNFAMPLIRYAVGDIGVPSDERCSCGRTLPLMKVVEGRKDSLIFLPNGQVMSPRAFSVAISTFRLYRLIEQFRFIQRKTGSFEILIKVGNSVVDEETMEAELVSHVKRVLGLEKFEVNFEVKFVDEIRLDNSGKFSFIVSEAS
jgi:phenylacetate-CoA ligase